MRIDRKICLCKKWTNYVISGYHIFTNRKNEEKLKNTERNGSMLISGRRILIAVLSGSVNIWVEDKKNFVTYLLPETEVRTVRIGV